MKKAYVSDYTFSENGSEIGLTFFEFEITNNSEDELAVDLLSQTFGLTVDGEAYPGVSIRSPRFIYKEFGDSGKTFDTAIQPGETRDGYICMEVPADFQSLRITYFPEPAFWTGTRHSSLTSIVRTWKLHRSRWKHSSKSLPANGLCAVLPQIQKSKRQADTNACRFSCTEQRQYHPKLTGQFCMQFPKNRSIDLTHHVALQKKV